MCLCAYVLIRHYGRNIATFHKLIAQFIYNPVYGRMIPIPSPSLVVFHACRMLDLYHFTYGVAEVSGKFMQSYAQLQPATSLSPPRTATLHARLAFAMTLLDVATVPLGFAAIVSPTVYIAAEPDPIPLPYADMLNVQVRW